MLLDTKISRRGFMQTAGALTFSFSFAGQVSEGAGAGGRRPLQRLGDASPRTARSR